jgi:tetratricopeptide (TPR) repeat protein
MIGQLLAERYEIKEVKDAGRTFVAEDKYRPGYPLCLIQRIQGQGSSVQTRTMAKLMLEQRVEAIGRLGKFSQIPGVLNFIETETAIYLVEEIVSGYLLSQEILPDQPWSEVQATELMQEVLEILNFMHQHRVVLRGLRPDNLVRRQSDGKLVLINLLMLPPKNIRIPGETSRPNLTAIYQPREQLEGNPVFSSNLYSLGMMALQAVTGLPAEALPAVKSHWFDRANVSREFAAVLDRLLSEDVKDRPATAQEVAKALRNLHQPEVLEPRSMPTELIAPPPMLAVHHAESGISPASEHPVTRHPAEPTILTPTPIPTVSLEPAQPPVSSDHGTLQGTSMPMSGLPPAKQIAQAPVAPLSPPTTVILRSPWRSKRLWGGLGLLAAIGAWTSWQFRLPQNAISAYYLTQGQDRSSRSLYKSAIGYFNDSLRWNKDNSSAFFQRGYAFYQIRNLPQALGDFTQVMNLDPHSSVAFSSLFYRGNIRMSLGDSQGAVRDYNQAIEVDSTDARAFVQRGQAENALGRSGNALKSYSQAIRLDPNLAAAYLNRCLTKSNLNDQPGAISDCTEATGINPTLITAYQNRGLAYHRAANYRAAISDLNVAIKLDGEDATSYYQRGLIRFDLQDKEGAIGDFNTAIQFKSDHVFAYYQRGLVQEKYGNLDGAIADLEMAMKLCVEQGMTGCYRDAQYQLKRLGKNNNPTQPTNRNQNPVFNDSYSPPTTPLVP